MATPAILEAPKALWQGLPGNTRGALWVLLAGVFFTVMASQIKILGTRLDSFEIAFFRALFGFIAIWPFVLRSGFSELKTKRPVMHLARGLLGVTAMFCGFYAITHLQLADAVAFTFTKPLFLIVLAVLFLNEKVRVRRWTATVIGFIGALVMLRPGGGLEAAAMVALSGSLCLAFVTVLIKKLTVTETPVTLLFYFGLTATLVATVPAMLVWQTPTWAELARLMLIGVLAATAQSFMIRGFAAGEATAVMPFEYARLLFAGLIGFTFFAEVPDLWTLVGAAIIVGATLYIAQREARIGGRDAGPLPVATD